MFGEERAEWRTSCEAARGRAELWRLPSACVGFRVVGWLDMELAEKASALMHEALNETPDRMNLVAFCDYSALEGADVPARTLFQETVKAHKERFEVLHYLVPNKLIALAVQVASLWHGIPSRTWTSKARIELEFVRAEAASRR